MREIYGFLDWAPLIFGCVCTAIFFSMTSDLSSVCVSLDVQGEKWTDHLAETSWFQFNLYFKHGQ